MGDKFEIKKIVDSLASISDIIYRRLKCVECNQCEPCGPVFMKALNTLREAGNIESAEGEVGAGKAAKAE